MQSPCTTRRTCTDRWCKIHKDERQHQRSRPGTHGAKIPQYILQLEAAERVLRARTPGAHRLEDLQCGQTQSGTDAASGFRKITFHHRVVARFWWALMLSSAINSPRRFRSPINPSFDVKALYYYKAAAAGNFHHFISKRASPWRSFEDSLAPASLVFRLFRCFASLANNVLKIHLVLTLNFYFSNALQGR
mgnify:CR=1 FL=1